MANDGLKTAGGVLPVVGVGILLRYLPRSNISLFTIRLFLAAYLKVPMLGVSIVGMVAMLVFKRDGAKARHKQQQEMVILKEDMTAMSKHKLTKRIKCN